jgi:hypothetical protein
VTLPWPAALGLLFALCLLAGAVEVRWQERRNDRRTDDQPGGSGE